MTEDEGDRGSGEQGRAPAPAAEVEKQVPRARDEDSADDDQSAIDLDTVRDRAS